MVQHADIDHTGLTGVGGGAHDTTHQNGGADELTVAGLSGLLADGQTPLAHAASHQNGGADEIDVTGLTGAGGTDDQTAAEVPFTPAGTIAATDTQAAVEEVATDAATALTGHTGDAADAHDASAISFTPAGTIAATDVQAAIEEVASEAGGGAGASDDHKQRANAYVLELDWSAGKYQDGSLAAVGSVSSNVWTGIIYFTPIYVPKAITIDRIGFNVVTGAAAGDEVRLGLYESGADGMPGALLLDAGVVAYSTNGGKEITISQALAADTVYWRAMTVNAGVSGTTFSCHADSTLPGYYLPSLTAGAWSIILHRAGFAYAALPNPAGTLAVETSGGLGGSVPSIRVRVA